MIHDPKSIEQGSDLLFELEELLKAAGMWSAVTPSQEALASQQPFADEARVEEFVHQQLRSLGRRRRFRRVRAGYGDGVGEAVFAHNVAREVGERRHGLERGDGGAGAGGEHGEEAAAGADVDRRAI